MQCSAWAVLAVAAMLASLLAVVAAPVGAAEVGSEDAEPNQLASTKACIEDALKDNGFTDVSSGHAFKDHINCIAYYKITLGTGDGSTFSPSDKISRAQAATMIMRATKAAGADLSDAKEDKFNDLEGVAQVFRDAINVLAENEIIKAGGNFRPDDDINRGEMAVMVASMLKEGSVVYNTDDKLSEVDYDIEDADNALDHFRDVREQLAPAAATAISELYELGVTLGVNPSGVFNPSGDLTRGQMAAFITRALDHTTVRPAGITAQHSQTTLTVSVRDENFQPRPNVFLDIFRIPTSLATSALNNDGTCDLLEVTYFDSRITNRDDVCEISNVDPLTQGEGDLIADLGSTDADGTTVWIWTGKKEDKVNSQTEIYRIDVPEAAPPRSATRVRVTNTALRQAGPGTNDSTSFTNFRVRPGSSVVYTVQLEDDKGAVSRGVDASKPAKFDIRWTVSPTNPTGVKQTPSITVTSDRITTDSNGKATFTVKAPTVRASAPKQIHFAIKVEIRPAEDGNAPVNFYRVNPANSSRLMSVTNTNNGYVDANDDSRDLLVSTNDRNGSLATVTLTTENDHVIADEDGASNAVTVKVVDQYGIPWRGARIHFERSIGGATRTDIFGDNTYAVAGREATYRLSYIRESNAQETEQVIAIWNYSNGNSIEGTATVEWATPAARMSQTAQKIREFDTETDTIFAGEDGAVSAITYDRRDRFTIDGVRRDDYARFERALSTDRLITWIVTSNTRRNEINTYELTLPSS